MKSWYKALLAGYAAVGLVWVPFVNLALAIAAPLYTWKIYHRLAKRDSPYAGIALTGLLISFGQVALLVLGYILVGLGKVQ